MTQKVGTLDTVWAKEQLELFIEMTTLHYPASPPDITVFTDQRSTARPNSEVVPQAQVVEQILDRVLPDWRTSVPLRKSNRWTRHREAAQRALAQLEREDELRERLGDNAPQLNANQMHPWVWEGARSLWQSRHFNEAVMAAAVKVNAENQNKVGRRDLSEADLFKQAFSTSDPKEEEPRLRLMDNDGSKTFSSMQRGAMALAEGCFAGLRNPGSHELQEELPEHEALEQLATFSVLARFVDRAKVSVP